mgnify:CR=1 FL=1
MNRKIFADSFIGTFYRGLHSGATHGYSRKNPIGFIYLWCASLMLFLSSPHTEARGHDLSALRRYHDFADAVVTMSSPVMSSPVMTVTLPSGL